MIEIRPLRRDEITSLNAGEYDLLSLGDMELKQLAESWEGKAIVAAENGKILGVAGVSVNGDTGKVGMVLSDELRQRPVFLHRTVKRAMVMVMDRWSLRALEATAHRNFVVARKWLTRLGFAENGENGEWIGYRYERH